MAFSSGISLYNKAFLWTLWPEHIEDFLNTSTNQLQTPNINRYMCIHTLCMHTLHKLFTAVILKAQPELGGFFDEKHNKFPKQGPPLEWKFQ